MTSLLETHDTDVFVFLVYWTSRMRVVAKIHEELIIYLETARKHPTGRLWVDCFVKPTLLSFVFLRSLGYPDSVRWQHF